MSTRKTSRVGLRSTMPPAMVNSRMCDMEDNQGQSAEALAISNNHHDIVEILRPCKSISTQALPQDVPLFHPYGPDDYIWIDTISIDQSSPEERTAQVSIMADIYSNATYVVVWLGEEDKYTDAAISAISKLEG